MSEHQIFASVNLLLVKDGKVLLSRRQNKSWGNGLLCIPGGHIEATESPTAAVIREAKEELDLNVDPKKVRFYCVAARNTSGKEYVAYEFVYELGSETYKNNEPEQCSELLWADPHDLPDTTIKDFRRIIEQGYLRNKLFLEIGYTN